MDPQTAESLLTVRSSPSLANHEARPRAADETSGSNVSPEERHMLKQKRRLLNLRPTGQGTIHVCWPCKVSFQLPSQLIAHQVYKHDTRGDPRRIKMACPVCRRKCKNQTIMALHLGTHKGERLCFRCGAEFASAFSAIAHKRLHRNGGSFKCGFCRKLFAHKSDRDEHRRLEHARQRQLKRLCAPTNLHVGQRGQTRQRV